MARAVGIDLGTTNSVVAVLEGGEPTVIPNAEGAALRAIAEAQGYATERVNRAHGESARFSAVLREYRQAPEVTRTRLYLETLNEVFPSIGQILMVQDDQLGPLPLLDVNRQRVRNTGGEQ